MKKKHNPHEAADRARLIVALGISILIMLAFNIFYAKPQAEKAAKQQEAVMAAQKAQLAANPVQKPLTRAEAVAGGGRVKITGKDIQGSLSLKGARLDDLLLNDQKIAVDSTESVALLSPKGVPDAYYVESGFLSASGAKVPDGDTVWSVKSGSDITAGGPGVTLEWNNGAGLTFERTITLDEGYLFTVTQKIVNKTGAEVTLNTYSLAARHSMPHDYKGFFVLHEGPVTFFDGDGTEINYKDLAKGEVTEKSNVKGWLGITDKYWMVSLLPDPEKAFNARVVGSKESGKVVYQADTVSADIKIAAGAEVTDTSYVYAGIKKYALIKEYQQKYKFQSLEYGIDFGMWSFITKPFYLLLHFLMTTLGNVGAAILVMTVIVRGAVYPLASKSFKSMAKMKTVGPKLKELQDKHKDDKAAMQMAIFELYKKEDVNPFSGCWPIIIQIPIFFALYKVILISIELRHTPFWGWVKDLSAPDPTSIFNLFGLLPFTPPQALMIGAWPLIFCLTMVLQKRISPPMPDPMQEKIQTYFPYIITVMMAHFSVGLVIYWAWSNVLGTLQQYYILRTFAGEDTSLIKGHVARRKKKTAKDAK